VCAWKCVKINGPETVICLNTHLKSPVCLPEAEAAAEDEGEVTSTSVKYMPVEWRVPLAERPTGV